MGQTTGGLPWPENTDPVAAGAQAIRALAESLDRLVYQAERVALFSVGGGGSDVFVGGGGSASAWELIDSNFAPTVIGPSTPQGFTTPRAGLWRVGAQATIVATLSGTTAAIVSVTIVASGGKEVGVQEYENGGGNVRRSYTPQGIIRLAAGETVRMAVSQSSGTAQNFGGGAAPGTRFTTRFHGQWVGP